MKRKRKSSNQISFYDVHYTRLDKVTMERDYQLLLEVCEELETEIQDHGVMNSFDLMRMR